MVTQPSKDTSPSRTARGAAAILIVLGCALSLPYSRAADTVQAAEQLGRGYAIAPPRPITPTFYFFADTNPYKAILGGFERGRPLAAVEEAAYNELDRLEETCEADALEASFLLDYLVSVRLRRGELAGPETRRLAERSVRIKERYLGPGHPEVTESLLMLGIVLEDSGHYVEAKEVYEKALAAHKSDTRRPRSAWFRHQLATSLLKTGDYVAARRLLEQMLVTAPKFASGIGQIGTILGAIGDYDEAKPVLERALSIQKKRNEFTAFAAITMNNLAIVLEADGECNGALGLFERSLEILEAIYGTEHYLPALARYNRARLSARLGRLASARLNLELARETLEASVGPDHPDVALALVGLANLATLEGDYETARPLYERSVDIQRRTLGQLDPHLPFSLASSAAFHWIAGEQTKAVELSLEAERLARRQFRAAVLGITERQALRYQSVRVSGLDLSLSYLASSPDGAGQGGIRGVWDQLVRSRALVLDEMASRNRVVFGAGDREMAERHADLARARHRLALFTFRALGSKAPSRYRERLKAAEEAKERAERALAETGISALSRSPDPSAGLQEIASALPAGAALVGYVRYDRMARRAGAPGLPSYLALVLRAGGTDVRAVPLGAAREIDARVREWRASAAEDTRRSHLGAGEAEARYRERAKTLRREIWDPVAEVLGESRSVFVVPDGDLHLVNFATLVTDEDRYLIETGPLFHYLSAERDLHVHTSNGARSNEGVLVLGAPDFDADVAVSAASAESAPTVPSGAVSPSYRGSSPDCDDFKELRFAPLPGSGAEVRALEQMWKDGGLREGSVMLLTGDAASESAFKRLAPSHRVIHVATHAFLLDEGCGPLAAEGRSPGPIERRPVVLRSPLLLSGLALAGANRRGEARSGVDHEDGILTAEEIASLDLTSVEWVVLSACESGRGELWPGEGVFGMRRAFEVAGAGSLIISLWPVEDDATRLWMEALYEARMRSLSTAEAVRQAGLRSLETARARGRSTHPFGWGAFVAAGDWR